MADDPETRFLPEAFKARRDKRKKAAEQKAPPARPTAPAPQPTSQPAQQYANDGAEFDDVSEYEDAGEGDGANEFGDDAAGYEFDQDNAPAPAPSTPSRCSRPPRSVRGGCRWRRCRSRRRPSPSWARPPVRPPA